MAIQVAAILGLLSVFILAMALLRRLAAMRDLPAEVPRKIVHVATGTLSMSLPWIFPEAWQIWLLLAMTLLIMAAMRTPMLAGLGTTLHAVERASYGDYFLVASIGLIYIAHGGVPILYVLPLAILTLGDAVAALAGSAYGRVLFRTADGEKSLEGSTMFFLVALILSMICLLLMTQVPRENVIVLSIAIALFAALVEANSWEGFDNLFLPIGVLIFLKTTVDIPVGVAILRLSLALLAICLVYPASTGAGFSRQTARVHALAIFMLMIAAPFGNAILSVCFLFFASYADRRAPKGRDTAALRSVGALACVSFGFIALGRGFGPDALDYYAMALAAMAASHGSRSFQTRPLLVRLAAAAALSVALCAVWLWAIWLNPLQSHWAGDIDILGAAAIVLASLVSALWPAFMAGYPNWRAVLTGAGPALVFYFVAAYQRGLL